MVRTLGRKSLWAYAIGLILIAVGYARYDLYMMDGDGTSFLDIADYMNHHRAAMAINGYWNPGYPAVLAFAERVVRPSLWYELATVRYTNVLIFCFALCATIYFTTGLTGARKLRQPGAAPAIPDGALHLLGLALIALSLGRELPVAAPRSDTLLYVLLITAGGLLVRYLQSPSKIWPFFALGITLGAAYLTKSFAFLPSLALIATLGVGNLLRSGRERVRGLAGTVAFTLIFAAVAGPYIVAISRQLGHFTTGESARLNYAFFVDLTGRWHEWYHHDLGHAGGVFVHPERVLATSPPVFSYAAHPQGTLPLWFDPAWWTLGIKPHVWMKGHLLRLARNLVVLVRFVLGRPEIFVLLGVLIAFGAASPSSKDVALADESPAQRWTRQLWFLSPVAWGLLMFAIYLPVDLQDRYLTAPLLLIMLPVFAVLQSRKDASAEYQKNGASGASVPIAATGLVVLFAGFVLVQAVTYLAERRRHIAPEEKRHAGYDEQVFEAAAALDALGLHPGEKVACMGDRACYTDFYWARLAGTQIEGEVETPGEANPLDVWNSLANKSVVTGPLAAQGLRFIVSLFPNSTQKPLGWVQLGNSNYFAYPLRGNVGTDQATRIAAFRATP